MLFSSDTRNVLFSSFISFLFTVAAGCGGVGNANSAGAPGATNDPNAPVAPSAAPSTGGTTTATGGGATAGTGATDPSTGATDPTTGTPATGTTGTGTTTPTAPGTPTTPAPTASAPTHHRCGWIGGDTADAGAVSFAANADYFDAIHPVWFTANADGTIAANQYADDARIVTVAKAHKVLLMPLIYGGDDGSVVRNIMSTQAGMTAHINNLVNLVVSRGYDGLEIDYEHLWITADRVPYVTMLGQLAVAMHAKGKQLSLSTSPQTADNGASAYGLAALVKGGVDVIHLMGYDYHSIDSDHQGPLAPLGWIDASAANMKTLGIADHVIMGLANYGVGAGWYSTSISDSISQCGGSYATTTTHMATCPYGVWAPGTAPHCTTAKGDLWFENVTSIGEKAKAVASHGLRGISYYTLGSEPAGFFTAIRAAYPDAS